MRPMMHEGRDRGGSRYVALHARTRDIFRTQDTYPPDKPSRRRGGRKVLVVDDQPDALDSTVELFGEPGEFHFLMKPFLMSEVAIVLRR